MTLNETQDQILAILDAATVFPVEEHAIPDVSSVPRDPTGGILPYIAVQFGDLIPDGATSFGGARADDYILPVYLQVVAAKPRDSRHGANQMTDVFLGASFPASGQVRKRVAGAQFPMENTAGGVEAYIFPLAFGVPVQLVVD